MRDSCTHSLEYCIPNENKVINSIKAEPIELISSINLFVNKDLENIYSSIKECIAPVQLHRRGLEKCNS
jgi:hypothetical protein